MDCRAKYGELQAENRPFMLRKNRFAIRKQVVSALKNSLLKLEKMHINGDETLSRWVTDECRCTRFCAVFRSDVNAIPDNAVWKRCPVSKRKNIR